jgi:hypothetical protein
MSKFRDWCLATGETQEEYWCREARVSSTAMKATTHKLPAPYNRATPNAETERMIQKLGLSIMADCFTFSTRLEGGGKIVSVGGSQRMVGSSQKGLPDAIGVRKGILYGIEFKRPGGHVSAIQYAKLKELHQAGARVCICVSPIKIREWVNIGTYTCKIDGWLEVL